MPDSLSKHLAGDPLVFEGIAWTTILEGPARAEDQLFRELAESLPLMIWAADESGKKVYCNQQYLQYIGVHSPSGMDSGWHLAIHPKDRERAKKTWELAVANGENYECEYRLRRADGSFRVFLARAVPVRDGAGRIVRWLGTSIDLHKERLAEADQRKAEKITAASRCATSLAHHINNPLSAATNSIYLALQDTTLSEVTRFYLDTAAAQVARIAHVTARSLGFYKQTGPLQQTDVSCVLASVLTFFESRFLEQGLTMKREIRPVPHLPCYQDDLSQAISAVIINAVQASLPEGVIRVRLRPCGVDSAGLPSGIRITVADSGLGVADEVREELFRPFVSTRGDAGAGLGLWMCQEIMRRHQSSIRFRSRNRHPSGTVFVFCLPLRTKS